MLPSRHRLTTPADFREVTRRGRRQGGARVVVHLLTAPASPAPPMPPMIGFTVSKAVGGAVVRNRVRRVLRHLVAARLDQLPPGSRVVVRALPPASSASSADLADDLDAALGRLLSSRATVPA